MQIQSHVLKKGVKITFVIGAWIRLLQSFETLLL